jgi:hypothetical protein
MTLAVANFSWIAAYSAGLALVSGLLLFTALSKPAQSDFQA